MLLYLPAPLFFILSTCQLAEVTLQLHQNFTIFPQMETQLQDNVCKNPEPSSVSSHCGFGTLNFHKANKLVTRSGLELHQLDHDEALHARDRESLENLEGLDLALEPLSSGAGQQLKWQPSSWCSRSLMKLSCGNVCHLLGKLVDHKACHSLVTMLLPNGSTGKSQPHPTYIQDVTRLKKKSKHLCMHHTNLF